MYNPTILTLNTVSHNKIYDIYIFFLQHKTIRINTMNHIFFSLHIDPCHAMHISVFAYTFFSNSQKSEWIDWKELRWICPWASVPDSNHWHVCNHGRFNINWSSISNWDGQFSRVPCAFKLLCVNEYETECPPPSKTTTTTTKPPVYYLQQSAFNTSHPM